MLECGASCPRNDGAARVHPDAMLLVPSCSATVANHLASPSQPLLLQFHRQGCLLVRELVVPWVRWIIVVAHGAKDLKDVLVCESLACAGVEACSGCLLDDSSNCGLFPSSLQGHCCLGQCLL